MATEQDPRRAEGAELLSDSSVILFHRMTAFQQTLAGLRQDGYHVVQLDAGAWRTARQMHDDLAGALDFPAYYGNNLDAFNDCLGDVAGHGYGFPEDATGLVLAMTGFDRFAAELPEVARPLLDIFADHSRRALADGKQMICLLQSTVPHFTPPRLSSTTIVWNRAERPSAAADPFGPAPDPPRRPWWRR